MQENKEKTGMVGLAPNWIRLAPNGKVWTFQDLFQYISRVGQKCSEIWSEKGLDLLLSQNVLKSDLKKARICCYWAKMYWNLIWKWPGFVPFRVKPDIPDPNWMWKWAYTDQLSSQQRHVLNDGQPDSPLGVLGQLHNGGQQRHGQLMDANHVVDTVQVGDDVQSHLRAFIWK